MSTLTARMELIRSTLATALTLRVVTRDLMDFSERADADLVKGVYTLVSGGEGNYKNYSGREAMDGAQRLSLIGQFRLDEDALGSAIEDAELAMVDEIKALLRTRPATLAQLYMLGFQQSKQLDKPYGWVAINLEFLQ